jgi:bacterioferritin (cytochrome b1)
MTVQPADRPEQRSMMKSYITKQPKHVKERVETKLDERLIRKLERYCQYLDSDRDYVISQLLEIAFKKDKGFAEWLTSQDAALPSSRPSGAQRHGEKTGRLPQAGASPTLPAMTAPGPSER